MLAWPSKLDQGTGNLAAGALATARKLHQAPAAPPHLPFLQTPSTPLPNACSTPLTHPTPVHTPAQAELLQLRQSHGRALSLRRTASGPSAPFPVLLSLPVEPPPEALIFDVGALTLELTLGPQLLDPDPPASTQCGKCDQGVESVGGQGADVRVVSEGRGMVVAVQSSELPAALSEAIARRLESIWAQQRQQNQVGQGG